VLLYHRIDDTADVHQLNVTRTNFVAHLEWLRQYCSVMPIEQLLGTGVADLPERPVAITFDDGYLDNLEDAAPALERAGLPATFFLTTRHLDAPGEYWWDLLERVFAETTPLPDVLEFPLASGALRVVTNDRESARATLHEVLVRAELADREGAVDVLRRVVAPPGGNRRPLVADEVRALARFSGASIGAHTVNHLSLPALADAGAREIEESRVALERVLGYPVRDLAYPYGGVDEQVARAVRRTWRWACACGDGPVADSFDAARVPRIEPGNVTAGELSRRIERVFDSICR
jgi:peptidoglycan/xylan/chitin deacetylase (PgdA/CDA1 family)